MSDDAPIQLDLTDAKLQAATDALVRIESETNTHRPSMNKVRHIVAAVLQLLRGERPTPS